VAVNIAGSLGPAHKGYQYQDQATSHCFALSLLDRFDKIIVDRKMVDDDRFDDLVVHYHSKEIRRQFKSSEDAGRSFDLADLLTERRKTRIDNLVRTHQRSGANAADEYRLCATWLSPTDSDLVRVLEPIVAAPTFPGHPSKLFRLRADLIWPAGAQPIWKPLRRATHITRQEFLDFANRFVIELECPAASRDFFKPGPLESLILKLLTESIGIGRYPYKNRLPVDVGAVLQQYAARARAVGLEVTPSDVERELQLYKDFGRVEQQFPIEPSAVVKRTLLRQELRNELGRPYVILIGPPGSGKSWELTELGEDLIDEGVLVARHYCYLEPGDSQVQRRITSNVMFANLIYELVQANPALERLHRPAYSAGRRELEDLLRKGVDEGLINQAALIVDGVDHISRVFADSAGIAKDETDIVEELAALQLPIGISVVLGTQPGAHLDPLLNNAAVVRVPSWRFGETAGLARRLDVPTQLRSAGLGTLTKNFLEQLHERSEGNPLYATFLCRQTLGQIARGAAFDPLGELNNAPLTGGDISLYYSHLLKSADQSGATVPIAELLGLIDFAITQEELEEIHPWLGHHIAAAITHLAPVLTPTRSQTGIGIYHESFRRFIQERLRQRGGSTADVLAPVIEWLKKREFFQDARSYRFLLPSLRRAGRYQELLDLIGVDFVSRSVAAGQPQAAVEQNLSLATYIAAEALNWPALTQCIELQKSCTVCFQDKLTDYNLFGRAFAAVYGAARLSERMIFDGRPTFDARQGLIFCSLCDDAGEIPPWAQYLSISRKNDDEESGVDENRLNHALAEFHGLIRLEGVETIYKRVVSWLKRVKEPHPEYFRGILKKLAQFGGIEILNRLLETPGVSTELRALIKIEVGQALIRQHKVAAASAVATEAVMMSSTSAVAVEGLKLGAHRTEVAKRLPSLDGSGAGLDEAGYPEAAKLKTWLDGVRIAAATDPVKLAETAALISGVGWYKNWLRFVISLARAEEIEFTDPSAAETTVLEALRHLSSDTAPFTGKPRACDLYSVKHIIHETLINALRLIRSQANFGLVVGYLSEISRGTTTYLQNSPSGPLIPEKLIEILMPFLTNADFKTTVLEAITLQRKRITEGDELYDTQASADLLLAWALAEAGEQTEAEHVWQSAAVNLCAYGYRREISIFDLTDSAPALSRINTKRAAKLLADAQPLVNAVDSHTDGKETKYAPIHWASALGKIDPVGAAYVVGRSLMKWGGVVDWRHEDTFVEIIDDCRRAGTPSLIASLDATVPIVGDIKGLERRLSTIERLFKEDVQNGTQLLSILSAKAETSESQELIAAAVDRLKGSQKAVVLPSRKAVERVEGANATSTSRTHSTAIDEPIFKANASPLELLVAIRKGQHSESTNDPTQDKLLNAFGYRLIEMIESGHEENAIRLLTSVAREIHFWLGAELLADLGHGLERHGQTQAAAVAFALAFARSRGGGGYLVLGDEAHLPWFVRACELSESRAWHTLANEIAHLLSHQGYYIGITRHLIGALAALDHTHEAAFEAWKAAFTVLRYRLPRNENDSYIFEKYDPRCVPTWSLDEALVFLLLARLSHPELGRKVSSGVGVLRVVATEPTLITRPLNTFLNTDVSISSTLFILQILVLAELSPFPITLSLQEQLRALYRSGLFGLRVMAQRLLEHAGLEVGSPCSLPTHNQNPVPKENQDAILDLDWGDRVNMIARMWPEFPSILAGIFHKTWEDSNASKTRARRRYRVATSAASEDIQNTRVLLWETELFEMLFHEVLEGIDAELWRGGEWDPHSISALLPIILPHVELHAARWHSRVKRPGMPLPSESSSGVITAVPISTNDEFNGWYRAGYYERELVMPDRFHLDEEVTLMAAVQMRDDETINLLELPLAQGSADTWVNDVHHTGQGDLVIRPAAPGPITGMDVVHDWLNAYPILMMRSDWQIRLGLSRSSSPLGRLELVDETGNTAVIFRYWEEQPIGDSIAQEVPRLQGCELLIRPDVFVRIARAYSLSPVTVRYRFSTKEEVTTQQSAAEAQSELNIDSKEHPIGVNPNESMSLAEEATTAQPA